MSSTFRQLSQQLYRELGLSGSVPATVVSQTNIRRRVVDWIAEADFDIQTLWADWNFMMATWTRATETSVRDYTPPATVARFDIESFWIDYGTANPIHLPYLTYKKWRTTYGSTVQSNGTPGLFTIKPDKTVSFDVPAKSNSLTLSADYWRKPTKMTLDGDTSPIPVEFERIIIARAKLMYAEFYKDQDMIGSAGGEYAVLLKRLEAAERPDQPDRLSSAPGLVVVAE